jgi:hypothetical protein
MCNCDNYKNTGEIIEDNGGGGEPPEVETTLHYTTSFNPNQDYLALSNPLYEDDYIKIGWDAPGNDLEGVVKVSTHLYESYLTRNHSSASNVLMSQINFKYDLYPTGITSTDVLNGGLACYNNPTAPYYHINVQRTGSSSQTILNIEIHNEVVDRT